jgi:hypothetical protein
VDALNICCKARVAASCFLLLTAENVSLSIRLGLAEHDWDCCAVIGLQRNAFGGVALSRLRQSNSTRPAVLMLRCGADASWLQVAQKKKEKSAMERSPAWLSTARHSGRTRACENADTSSRGFSPRKGGRSLSVFASSFSFLSFRLAERGDGIRISSPGALEDCRRRLQR